MGALPLTPSEWGRAPVELAELGREVMGDLREIQIRHVLETMAQLGVSGAEVWASLNRSAGAVRQQAPSKAIGKKIYCTSPTSDETWDGQLPMPLWVQQAVLSGGSLASLTVRVA